MSNEHRVAGHLGMVADEYDATIRRLVPHYERMLATVVQWLEGHVPPGGLVADLGAGTGGLSAAILAALPDVRVRLVDIDPNMLEVAAASCSAYDGRYELREGRFEDELPPCHAVVASLALHHVERRADKRHLYRAVLDALEPSGLMVVGDALLYPDGPERSRMVEALYEHMERSGIARSEARAHFAQWQGEDFYVPLPDELGLLVEAGFQRPDVFWRDGLVAVYGAFARP
jgi:tRNA (cmo5U34)-methyltransferase